MIFRAFSSGRLEIGTDRVPCALGRNGLVDQRAKREGDGRTPVGRFALREVLYRSDRLERPATGLPLRSISPLDGWCDDPSDPAYNRPVAHPYAASAEHLWREDEIYDVVVVLGHNDDPVVPGMGSAIFLHVARPDYAGTLGCVALAREDLLRLISVATPGDELDVAWAAPGPNPSASG